MLYADEIRDPGEVDNLPGSVKPAPRELELAERLIESADDEVSSPSSTRTSTARRCSSWLDAKARGQDDRDRPHAGADGGDGPIWRRPWRASLGKRGEGASRACGAPA
jgi:non-homologous end joining protein Ku